MSKDSCEHIDCCPVCGLDVADELDEKAAAVNLKSDGHLVGRCNKCNALFQATPEIIWITEAINEH